MQFAAGGEGKPDGEAAILKDDLRNLQGRWELVLKFQGRTIRSVQSIEGNKSTVTRYDEKGAVLEAHSADFTLSISGRTRIFTYFNYEVTAGPNKGRRGPQRAFVYRVDGDSFFEARGLLVDQGEPVALSRWKRVKERVAAGSTQPAVAASW
jgi:hypothetical protein